jgi:hypothetical protein
MPATIRADNGRPIRKDPPAPRHVPGIRFDRLVARRWREASAGCRRTHAYAVRSQVPGSGTVDAGGRFVMPPFPPSLDTRRSSEQV